MASADIEPKGVAARDRRISWSQLPASWRRAGAALLMPLLVLSGVVIAAIMTGAGIGPVTGGLESLSSASATALGRVISAAPLGYAVGAGMLAAVNPCGFAMLPSYLGLYLGAAGDADASRGIGVRLLDTLRVGGTVSLSFVLLFGLAGIFLSLATATIARWLPWLALAVGVLLVFTAGRVLAGAPLYVGFGERLAARMEARTRHVGLPGYFAYGLAYGLASLSCTLPIFLAVVASALARNGFLAGALQFILYAFGMGLVISMLTLGVVVFQQGALRWARAILPYVQPLSALLLLAAGAYIVYYWLTVGGLLRSIGI